MNRAACGDDVAPGHAFAAKKPPQSPNLTALDAIFRPGDISAKPACADVMLVRGGPAGLCRGPQSR